MSSPSLTVSVRRESKELASVTLTKGCDPVLVGRSASCTLKLPSDDYSASGTHARIFWKGSSLMIEDAGSRNGIFKNGQPVKRAEKLVPGTLYAVGSCILSVVDRSKALKAAKNVRKYHRLEFLNGDDAGRMVDIVPREDGKEFDIGLDSKCSIHLRDLLVSRRHAVLKTNEVGECWIEDLGSRNGTFVNDERLSGKERLLRDGDVISVAFFKFRFLDRKVAHTRVHMLFKLGVVMVTGCVIAMGYIAWKASQQTAQVYLDDARRAAARGDFNAARSKILESRDARDFSDSRQQIDAFANKMDMWEKTYNAWNEVQAKIAANNLGSALKTLDGLVSGPVEAWGWNPNEMATIKKDADMAARAMHLYFDGKDAVEAAGNDANADADLRVRAMIGPIESFIRVNGDAIAERKFLSKVMEHLATHLEDLRTIRAGYDVIDESISKISAKTPDFHLIYSDFDKIANGEKQSPAVRSYARQQLTICQAFVAAQDFLDEELAKLVKLDFAGVRQTADEIKLPSQEICLRHSRYSDARAVFAERHRQLLHETAAIQVLIESLASVGVTESQRGDDINLFLNTTNIVKALKFDCLTKGRPPNMRRPAPVGDYDNLFGIEYTYESLRALPNAFNGHNIRAMNFTPRCDYAQKAFDSVEKFVQYLDGEDKRYLQKGNLGRYYTQCVRILTARENLVQWLKDFKGSERAEIVASFYADYFALQPSDVAKRMLRDRFNKLRRDLNTLNDRYMLETDPEKQLAVRDEIMAKGIPGDPILHAKWAQKFDLMQKFD